MPEETTDQPPPPAHLSPLVPPGTDLLHGAAAQPLAEQSAQPARTFAVGPALIAKDKNQRTLMLLQTELAELSAACGWLALSADVAGYQAKLGGIAAGLTRISQRLTTLTSAPAQGS